MTATALPPTLTDLPAQQPNHAPQVLRPTPHRRVPTTPADEQLTEVLPELPAGLDHLAPHRAAVYRYADALGVPVELLGLPPLDRLQFPQHLTPGPDLASTCHAPIPGAQVWERCILRTAHPGTCLPAPARQVTR